MAPKYAIPVYSQEGEDICLWRIISPTLTEPGVYVDVGSNHPWHCSNTGFYYEKGWRGVAIDPNPDFTELYARMRPGDTFINKGVSDVSAQLTYYRFDNSLYNTFCEENVKNLVSSSIVSPPQEVTVGVEPLSVLLERVWPGGKEIDLLSIDAEGLDFQIVKGNDFEKFPVKYLIIETEDVSFGNLLSVPVIEYLTNHGFTAVSKLCKSVILIRNSELSKCGLYG